MGKYIDANGQLKNVLVLKAFALSFLMVAIFAVAYIVSAGPAAELAGGEIGGFAAVWGPPALIATGASLVCCLLMIPLQNKIVVPVSFLFLLLYYLLLLAVLVFSGKDTEQIGAQLVSIYLLPPVLLGNLICWGIYLLWMQHAKRRTQKRLHKSKQRADE